ncbi:MAG: phosphoglucosamine mutase [Chloroflexi bacterium]|nr:phosphoglucosamine mutase [Chloroflexota bacterium]
MSLFGSSGYRGVVDRAFLETAFRLGLAAGKALSSVLLAQDTRTSSDAVKCSVAAGLMASGCSVFDAGVAPTPTLAYACRRFSAGVMVTASHNPPEYNGIKLWNTDGSAFDAQQRDSIERMLSDTLMATSPWQNISRIVPYPLAVQEHLESILKDFPGRLPLKVVVDCGCGAGSVITPYLLEKLGCHVVALNSHPSGFFPRGIEPTPGNLDELQRTVVALGADLGLAHDADADRLTVIDDKGQFLSGDKLMLLLGRELGVKRIVTTVDASMSIDEQRLEVIRTKVGDAFVSEELKNGGDFGGEPAGAWVFPSVSYCPDGIYSAACAVKIASKGKLSEQAGRIPSYPIRRGSTMGDRGSIDAAEQWLMELQPTSVSRIDGLRLAFDDAWLLVRPSGTEPKVRLTVEARTKERADALYEHVVRLISRESEREGFRR